MQHSILNSYKKDILENKTMTAKCKRVLETSIDLLLKMDIPILQPVR